MSAHEISLGPAELRRLVVDGGRSFASVARDLGVHPSTVERHARKWGISSSHTRVRCDRLHDRSWLQRQFDAGRTISEVANELGVAYGTVVNARMSAGIAPRRSPRVRIDIGEVRRRLAQGESQRSIAQALGCTSAAISKAVRRHGLSA